MQLNVYIYYTLLIGVCLAAFAWGSSEHKKSVIACSIASIASSLVAMNHSWNYLSFHLFAIDLLLLIYFYHRSMVTEFYWPYWTTAWQLVSVFGHIQRYLFINILPESYSILVRFMSYSILLLIFLSIFVRFSSNYGFKEQEN